MARINYSVDIKDEHSVRAIGRELDISSKDSMELCKILKGMSFEKAEQYLKRVIDLKQAVPYKRYLRIVAHKLNIGPGRFPKKAALRILKTLEKAKSYADTKNLDVENLYIYHIASHKGRVYKKRIFRAYGRSTPFDKKTTNIEVILKEKESERK